MAEPVRPDALVYICHNCVPQGAQLSRQWTQDGVHLLIREIPCSGKIDLRYLIRILEDGARGVCVVACPKGTCRLGQGNYRAEIRIGTIRRLLGEIELEPDRVVLCHCSPDDPPDRLRELLRDAVQRFVALGESPLRQEDAGKGEVACTELPVQA